MFLLLRWSLVSLAAAQTTVFYVFEDDVKYVDYETRRQLRDEYNKPSEQDSSLECFRVAQRIRASYRETEDGHIGCMACDPTVGFPETQCASGSLDCQSLIDDLYRHCRGKKHAWPVPDEKPKTMPDGYFYDPLDTISGKWSKSVRSAIKIAVERCGCDAAGTRAASLPLLSLILALTCCLLVLSR